MSHRQKAKPSHSEGVGNVKEQRLPKKIWIKSRKITLFPLTFDIIEYNLRHLR